VLAYLARYTHRVAITNRRLLDVDQTHVTFSWKDYRKGARRKHKVMRVDIGEFMRRFLLHILPNGFHRIRHYGLLANGHRARKVALCRKLLAAPDAKMDCNKDDNDRKTLNYELLPSCPCCGGQMFVVESFMGSLCRPYPARILDGL
jgi:Putative transposase